MAEWLYLSTGPSLVLSHLTSVTFVSQSESLVWVYLQFSFAQTSVSLLIVAYYIILCIFFFLVLVYYDAFKVCLRVKYY